MWAGRSEGSGKLTRRPWGPHVEHPVGQPLGDTWRLPSLSALLLVCDQGSGSWEVELVARHCHELQHRGEWGPEAS